jgi:hypothetical protein
MFELSDLASVAERNDEALVRAEVLDANYLTCGLREATLRVAKLLLLREPSWDQPEVDLPNVTDTAVERLVDRLKAEGLNYRAVMLSNWATARQGWLPLYALFLYNSDYGRSRAILEYMLTGEKNAPPYLKLALLNILHQSVGLSHDELHEITAGRFDQLAPWINRIFHDDAVFDWMKRKKRPLRFYGGVTNTVLGLYDGIFADPTYGTQHINRAAERFIDLGGGFNTSEIERLMGCRFVSADLATPRLAEYDEELIMLDLRENKNGPVATEAARQEFLARQNLVEHLPFDVFEDQLPIDASSYTIVSTGFMTSNLRPQPSQAKDVKAARLGTISTSVHAAMRVMELVVQGKSVDLFTIQRATSRVFHYKTCLLQWREGRLARLVTTVDPRSTDWGQKFRYDVLDPMNPRFRRLMNLPLPEAPNATDASG